MDVARALHAGGSSRAELVLGAAVSNEVIARLADRSRRPGPRCPGGGAWTDNGYFWAGLPASRRSPRSVRA
jgi:hypothetical protein